MGPFSYDPHRSKDILNRRKDFALKLPQGDFSPTREMAFLKKSPSQENIDEFDQPIFPSHKHAQKPMKPLGINYLAATVDPQGVQQQSHIY